jgi:probable F420-dependent oxidoreductase
MTPFFSPGPIEADAPPVLLAAINEYNAETVGVNGDGLLVHPVHSRRYLDEVIFPAIDRGLEQSKRTREDITVQCPVFLVVGRTPEERQGADQFVRSQIAFYGSTRTYRRIFETHGWDATPGRLHERMSKGDFAGMAAEITDEMLDVFAITGGPDDVVDKVRERYTGVADRLYFYNLFASPFASDDGRLREVVTALASS